MQITRQIIARINNRVNFAHRAIRTQLFGEKIRQVVAHIYLYKRYFVIRLLRNPFVTDNPVKEIVSYK